jgi:shikimate kinase
MNKKLSQNIVLIGMMGSGKTMVAKALAQKLGMEYLSTDALVEEGENRSIADIVKDKGWPYFRQLEHKVIKLLSSKKGVIIDCGGGVVLNPENFDLLKKNGTMFFLKADPEVIYQRLKGDKTRPLMNVPNPQERLQEILKERLPLYSQADYTIDASDPSIEGPVIEILQKI